MVTRPYELLVRFGSVAGSVAGVSIRTITDVNGRDYESDPQPLAGVSDPAFSAFAVQFSAEAVAARDAALVQVATLTAEVTRLTALIPPPPDPRQIYPRELLGRLTRAEVVAAIRSDDAGVIYAVANLQTAVSPVLLDSQETRLLIGSLVVAGILTEARMLEILS